MTNNNDKNKTKTATTIISALVIGLVLLSPMTIMPNVNATPTPSVPALMTKWFSAHHHFAGCVSGNLKTGTVQEVPCADPNIAHPGPHIPGTASKSKSGISPNYYLNAQTIDCSSHCWAGAEFYNTGPYNEATGDTTVGSAPSTVPTQFSYWSGITNCTVSSCPTHYLLVQSGWFYDNGVNSNNPTMFAEIYGNFNYNSQNCATSFCGSWKSESAGNSLYSANYADTGNSQWVAYVQDSSTFTSFTVPFSTTNLSNSLAYAITSQEAQSASSISYFPSSPINYTSITLYSPGSGQVNADTNNMYSYDYPISSTGINIGVQATGTTTANIGNYW